MTHVERPGVTWLPRQAHAVKRIVTEARSLAPSSVTNNPV